MARKVLMIGPSLSQRGGIASVENTYIRFWNTSEFELKLVATYTSHFNTKAKKLTIACIALVRTVRILMFWKPDLVHVHFSWKGSIYRKMPFIVVTRLLFRTKLVLHCHAADFESFYLKSWSALQLLIRWMLGLSDRLLVLSTKQATFFHSIVPHHPLVVLANPVQCPAAIETNRERTVLILGELGVRKGTYDVLDAIPAILERCPDLAFSFGGDGDLQQIAAIVATKEWKDRVRILGWVEGADKIELLNSALIFLLPSYQEGLPVALLEAMAHGLPIVSTPVGGIPDIVSDGEEAVLVKPGDVAGIVSAITRLAENVDLRSALSFKARRRVIEACEASAVVGRLHKIYMALLLPEEGGLPHLSQPHP